MANDKKGGGNFNDFNVDDLNFDFGDSGIHPDKNDRTPFTKFKGDFYSGIKEQTRSASFYKNLLRKALPKDYRDALDSIGNAASQSADLYNTSVNKLNPSVRALKKATQRILPSSDKIIPNALQKKLKDWVESDYYGQGAQLSPEQQQDAQIGINLGDVFATQITETAKQHDDTKRRDVFRSVLENKRHIQSMDRLDYIRNGIGRLVGYQDNVTIKYQRKSLELQYRQLYATRDLITAFNEKSNKNLEALMGIVKNTGLPDAVKLRGHEQFGNIARERFITKIQGSAFNGLDKLVERFTKNAGRMLNEKIGTVNDIVDQLTSAGEMASGNEGRIAASVASEGVSHLLSGPLGKYLAKNRKLTAFLARTNAFVRNAPGHLDHFTNSKTRVDESTWKGRAKGYGIDTLKELLANNDKATIGAGDMSEAANDASSFTVLARKSITDIIPGYLARILREVTIARTGNDSTPLLSYNLKRGMFSNSSEIRDNFRDRIRSKESIVTQKKMGRGLFTGAKDEVRTGTGDYVNTIIDKIDPSNKLSTSARAALAKQLLHNSLNDKGFIPKHLADVTQYHSSIGGGDREELASFMKRKFRTDRNRKLGEGTRIDTRINDISGEFGYLAQNVPAIIDEIELILRLPDGREHLEALGFLTFKDGVSSLSYDAVVEFLLGVGGIHAKGGSSSDTNGSNGSKPTFRYAGNRSSYTWSAYLRSNASALKGHSPVSIFRNMVSGTVGIGISSATKVKGFLGSITNATKSFKAKYASSEQLASHVKKGQAINDNVRYQMWLAKQAVKDKLTKSEWVARVKDTPHDFTAEIGGGDTRGSNIASEYNKYESESLKLLEKSSNSLENIKDLLQAGIQLNSVHAGDGRRYGFRYGIRSGLGKLFSGGAGLLKAGMSAYGSLLGKTAGAAGSLISGAGKLAGNVLSRIVNRRFSDIYVKGNRNPSLFAAGIRRGIYTDVLTKTVIKKLGDITGPVIDDSGNQVLSIDDFQKGLFDVQGKPVLRNLFNKAIGFYGALFSPVAFAAKAAVGVMGFIKNQLTKEKDIYVRTDPTPRFPRMRVSIMQTGGYQSIRTKKLILSIKDLDGPVEDRDGNLILSAQDLRHICDINGNDIKTLGEKLWRVTSRIAGFGARVAIGAVKMAYGAGKGLFNMAKGVGIKGYNFLMRGLGLSGVEAVTIGNSNSTVALLRDIRDILDSRLPSQRRNAFGDTNGDGIRDGSAADILGRRAKARAAAMANKAGIGGAGLFSGLGARLKGLFGNKDSEKEGDTNIIGGIGGSDKAGGSKPMGRMGRAWEKVKGFGRKIPGAKYLGTLGRGALTALSFLGLGGVGGALLTGGATILSSIAAVIASPIVLGALAVGAAGAGLYYGYKYLKGTAKTEFRNFRLAQYGIDPANAEQSSKVLKLEDSVAKFISFADTTASLKMEITDIIKVMTDFGVSKDDHDRLEHWVTWFNERFKIIYANHRAAAEKAGPGSSLADMDNKWNNAQKLTSLMLLKQPLDYPPYTVFSTPFPSPLSGNRATIVEMFDTAEKAFKTASDSKATANDNTVKVGAFVGTSVGIGGATLIKKDASVPMDINQLGAKAAVTNQVKMKGSVSVTGTASTNTSRNNSLTALDSIRLKAYGLVNLDIDKVRTLRDLERAILPDIVFSTKAVASFEGKAEDYLNKYASMFGIATSNTEAVYNWSVWFSSRFIPVLVAYCTAVREQNSTVDILDSFQYLKPDQALSVGQSLISVKTGGFFSSSVWSIPHTPWIGYTLNTDSGSTKGNLDALTMAVKNRTYADTTAILGSALIASKSASEDKSDNILMDSSKNGEKAGGFFSTMSNIIIGKRSSPANLVERAVEGKSSDSYGNDTYMMPVAGRISSIFGMRDHPIYGEEKEHKGIDIAAPNGTPIRAAASGTITVRGVLRGYGNVVYIRHPDGKSTRYAHMSHFQPGYDVGSAVRKGDIIGYVGSTGDSTGNHLHFEVREDSSYDAKAIDPIKFLGDRQQVASDLKDIKGLADAAMPAGTPAPSTPTIDASLDTLSNPAPTNSYVGVVAPAMTTPTVTADDVIAQRKKQDAVQARTIETRNKQASARASDGMASVVEVLNRSYDVQVEIRNGIADLKSVIGGVPIAKVDTSTDAVNPGRRPTPAVMRSNPVSLRKSGL